MAFTVKKKAFCVLEFAKTESNVTVQRRFRCRPVAGNIVGVHYTTSCNTQTSAPEDGQNNFPKHVELTGIINKPLLLHLVGCLYYLYFIIYFFETC